MLTQARVENHALLTPCAIFSDRPPIPPPSLSSRARGQRRGPKFSRGFDFGHDWDLNGSSSQWAGHSHCLSVCVCPSVCPSVNQLVEHPHAFVPSMSMRDCYGWASAARFSSHRDGRKEKHSQNNEPSQIGRTGKTFIFQRQRLGISNSKTKVPSQKMPHFANTNGNRS